MASAIEYGVISAGIAAMIVAVVHSKEITEYFLPDPVKARYELIDRKCAKPTPDGKPRQIVYLDDEKSNFGYVHCPR